MRPPRILVVEDHPDIAVLVQVLLQRVGCEVISAANGQDALTLFAQRRPDAVVLDLNLPRLPGWEVCKVIKRHSNTPVIVVTGQTPTEGAAERLAMGADVYLLKPFKVMTLLTELQRLLRLRVAEARQTAAARSGPAAPQPRRTVSQRAIARQLPPAEAPAAAPPAPAPPVVHTGGLIL